MDDQVGDQGGGIVSLQRFLDGEFAGAIRSDLLDRLGLHAEDIGEVIGWHEFKIWAEHLPPVADSALFRARHPHDWWYDMPLRVASWQLLALQGANWQRAGGKGTKPKVFEPTYPKTQRAAPKNVIPIDQIKRRLEDARAAAQRRKSS
ncbi:hypothetical protein [Nocardia sp. NPDC004260]